MLSLNPKAIRGVWQGARIAREPCGGGAVGGPEDPLAASSHPIPGPSHLLNGPRRLSLRHQRPAQPCGALLWRQEGEG